MGGGNISQVSSSPADRRIDAFARHLEETSSTASGHASRFIIASPMSGSFGARLSVFNHLVQAPEDPILGTVSMNLPNSHIKPIKEFILV
ncbi:hypothetical protein M569_06317 [Genlisea aurea]|uniref:Uncharacterized protein n=1 Tax=Genlisea aurea TaxID=192259 RepID=S8DYS9_9LAMI|nr:hypothetical protein M569_06317 [Genlisea aurea]